MRHTKHTHHSTAHVRVSASPPHNQMCFIFHFSVLPATQPSSSYKKCCILMKITTVYPFALHPFPLQALRVKKIGEECLSAFGVALITITSMHFPDQTSQMKLYMLTSLAVTRSPFPLSWGNYTYAQKTRSRRQTSYNYHPHCNNRVMLEHGCHSAVYR